MKKIAKDHRLTIPTEGIAQALISNEYAFGDVVTAFIERYFSDLTGGSVCGLSFGLCTQDVTFRIEWTEYGTIYVSIALNSILTAKFTEPVQIDRGNIQIDLYLLQENKDNTLLFDMTANQRLTQ